MPSGTTIEGDSLASVEAGGDSSEARRQRLNAFPVGMPVYHVPQTVELADCLGMPDGPITDVKKLSGAVAIFDQMTDLGIELLFVPCDMNSQSSVVAPPVLKFE